MDSDRERAYEAGCNHYITKPIDTKIFMDTVKRFLKSSRLYPAVDRRGPVKTAERRRILIAGDDPGNVKSLKAMLPREKYEVCEACFDGSIVKTAAEILPDVIFIDITLPGTGVFEMAGLLKEKEATSHIPVVFVTALGPEGDMISGLEAGAEEFLVKPVNRVEMISRTRSMVRLNDYRMHISMRRQAAGMDAAYLSDRSNCRTDRIPLILFVDGSTTEINILKASLEAEPYEIITADTGREALSIFKEKQIDLLMLDIMLPDMDGWSVLERARKPGDHNTLQTLVMTGADDLYSRVKGVELGVDDYLVKPADPCELRVRINALLKKKAYRDQLINEPPDEIDPAIKDPITGLYNRGFFLRFLELELKRTSSQRYPTSLIGLTIADNTPPAGQEGTPHPATWLLEISTVLKRQLRDIDLVARTGDASLTVLLPNCDEKGVYNVAMRVRATLADRTFPFRDEFLERDVSLNMGTVTIPYQARTVQEILALLESGPGAGKTDNAPALLKRIRSQGRL
jgi:two-component system cell cycle response regulator